MCGEAQVPGRGADGGAPQRLCPLRDLGQEHHSEEQPALGRQHQRGQPGQAQGGDQTLQM